VSREFEASPHEAARPNTGAMPAQLTTGPWTGRGPGTDEAPGESPRALRAPRWSSWRVTTAGLKACATTVCS